MDKNWKLNVSFSVHVNFDHAWAEHYPVTLYFYAEEDNTFLWVY